MPGESISQIPQQASVVNGPQDLLEISQYTGIPGALYVTKKATVALVASAFPAITARVVIGTFTLNANAASTIVPVTGVIAATSNFAGCPTPLTPHAANDMATTSYAMGSGQFVVTHANNARLDRTFSYIIFL